MTFKVKYSIKAKQDLKGILDYIGDVLFEPEIALKQVARIKKAADSLDIVPFGRRLYDEEPWKSQGVRFFPVDNYLVFYLPDESKRIVRIISIIHSKANVKKLLSTDN